MAAAWLDLGADIGRRLTVKVSATSADNDDVDACDDDVGLFDVMQTVNSMTYDNCDDFPPSNRRR
jgi:hypothetical protein